jgi:hypothetical protein
MCIWLNPNRGYYFSGPRRSDFLSNQIWILDKTQKRGTALKDKKGKDFWQVLDNLTPAYQDLLQGRASHGHIYLLHEIIMRHF